MGKRYDAVKRAALVAIDYVSEQDLDPNLLKQPAASATLASLGIPGVMNAWLCKPLNKQLIVAEIGDFTLVEILDLQQAKLVGDVIAVACKKSKTKVPKGEPT